MSKPKHLSLPDLSDDSQRFLEDLQEESDRGAALVAAAFINDLLKAIIRAVLIDDLKQVDKLFEYPGTLQSFAARAELLSCMGLIGPTINADIICLVKIRNEFH